MNMDSTHIRTRLTKNAPRRTRRFITGLGAALLLAMVTLPSVVADPAPPPREIVLVARNMAFYLDGNPTPNPTLRLKAGERVNLVLRSEDAGITHDFAVKAWAVGTAFLSGKGVASVTFVVPDRARQPQQYACTAHAAMMQGVIEVE